MVSTPVGSSAEEDPKGNNQTSENLAANTSTPYGLSPLASVGGLGGMGYGMYGSPYGYGGMAPMMGGPFSGLHQVLFGVQNVIFSVNQVVQMLGVNQHALQQTLDSLTQMVDKAIATFHELRALEAQQEKQATEEQLKRKSRLKALRWALLVGTSWIVYKIIRRLAISKRRRRITSGPHMGNMQNNSYGLANPTPYSSYQSSGPYYSSPYNGMGMNPGNGTFGGGFY